MKYFIITLTISFLLGTFPAFADNQFDSLWFITRGGPNSDEAWGVDTDSEGNIYWATHQTVPGPYADILLYKVSPDGNIIWETRWGDQWNEQAYIVSVREPFVYVGGAQWTGLWLNSLNMAVILLSIVFQHFYMQNPLLHKLVD